MVMVPNSLGPGELIEKFGTDAQKQQYLEPLAKGREIPCFALTSPFAGSDAASMRDVGYVEKGMHNGQEVIGIRVSWDKRYITLGAQGHAAGPRLPSARPAELCSARAAIPASRWRSSPPIIPACSIGRRHLPSGSSFPNGPTSGENVFIPLDWVVGGADRVGQGWRMLMSCLAAGRAISLPASSTAGAKALLRFTTAYARIRKQFAIPIGRMEGIEEPLALLGRDGLHARSRARGHVRHGEPGRQARRDLRPDEISDAPSACAHALNAAFDIHGGQGHLRRPQQLPASRPIRFRRSASRSRARIS